MENKEINQIRDVCEPVQLFRPFHHAFDGGYDYNFEVDQEEVDRHLDSMEDRY